MDQLSSVILARLSQSSVYGYGHDHQLLANLLDLPSERSGQTKQYYEDRLPIARMRISQVLALAVCKRRLGYC